MIEPVYYIIYRICVSKKLCVYLHLKSKKTDTYETIQGKHTFHPRERPL